MNLEELKQLAHNATPGPWFSDHHGVRTLDSVHMNICQVSSTRGKYELERDNRDFIAAANPKVILELIERLRVAEAR